MGDSCRGQLFAQFILKQFPQAKTILVVADGKGQVARKLANKKRRVVVVEQCPRWEGRQHKDVRYIAGTFTPDYKCPEPVSLVVGMHPDEATGEIIKYALKHNLPFAVCPCCRKGRHAVGVGSHQEWLTKLRSLAVGYDTWETQLKMTGKNIVIAGKPK